MKKNGPFVRKIRQKETTDLTRQKSVEENHEKYEASYRGNKTR